MVNEVELVKQVVLSIAGMLLATGVSGATITNGSFEQPGTYSGPFTTIQSNSGGLYGWDVTAGSVDLINTLWQHSDGNYSLDLDGNAPATISQSISGLTVGQTYTVLFDLASNPASAGSIFKTLTVAAGLDAQRYLFDRTGQSVGNMGWVTETFTFTAANETERLEFMSTSENGPYGPALDNVRFAPAPVPLPAGAVLMLSALGLLSLRRKV